MSRLFLINVLLLGGIAWASLKLIALREETAKREELVRAAAPKLPAPKPVTPVSLPERTVAANYLDIAARLLFSKDRNPSVIIAPAPVKQMPPLPLSYGVLMVADPPIIMLSPKKGDPQKGFHAGDKVGDFKIVSFDNRNIVLEWDGQKVPKELRELADRDAQTAAVMNQQAASQAPAAAAPAAAAPAAGGGSVLGSSSAASKEMGVQIGEGMQACAAGDTSPAGTVKDGYRKVVSESPFGRVCRWEKIK